MAHLALSWVGPALVNRCHEAMPGDDKLSMATIGRGQFHLEGAAQQGGFRICQLQLHSSACVTGAIIADAVAQGNNNSRLHFSHADLFFCL